MPDIAAPARPSTQDNDLAARETALDLLRAVLTRKQALDHALEQHEGLHALDSRNRNFCRMLVATTLRRMGQIDAMITKAADRPQRISETLSAILRLGTAQIVFMAVADHAAVDTAVRLCEHMGLSRQKGFINAMLRTIARNAKDWLSKQDETRLNTPDWLLKIWIEDYGLRTAAMIAKANLSEAAQDITLSPDHDRADWSIHLDATPIGHSTLRRLTGGAIHTLPGFDEGAWWVQDAAAAIPAHLFGDIKGKTVIDLCAAPGGKTMQLAAQGAHVIAVDRSAKRLEKLYENAHRLNMTDQITIQAADANAWTPAQRPDFILLDAPCSATGTIRRNPDLVHLKSENDLHHLERVQAQLLQRAFDSLAPGGILVYCTCALQKSEGERQMEAFLESNQGARKIAITGKETGGFTDCITDSGDMRILPFHHAPHGGMDGFFISRIAKI